MVSEVNAGIEAWMILICWSLNHLHGGRRRAMERRLWLVTNRLLTVRTVPQVPVLRSRKSCARLRAVDVVQGILTELLVDPRRCL